jgi:hypothetical protein
MPRKPAIVPTEHLHLKIDELLLGKIKLELLSEVEGRVPQGEYRRFFEARAREYFSRARIDVAELVPGTSPGMLYLYGDRDTIELIRNQLKGVAENDTPPGRNAAGPATDEALAGTGALD